MTTEILIFAVALMVAAIPLLWFVIWRFTIKHSKEFQPVSPSDMNKKQLRKQQMNTEVVLTDDEKRAMKKNMWKIGIIVGIILLFIIGVTGWNYWRFAVKGESVQATITNVSKHRSSGKSRRTTYTYTLSATVDGVVVKDSYGAGSSGAYKVGDVVETYADTSGVRTDLAIASVVDRSPFSAGTIVLIAAAVIGSALYAQGKNMKAGKARIANLPSRFREARIASLPRAETSSTAQSIPTAPVATTPDGLPMYTIGGSREQPKDNFPKIR